MAPTSRAQRRVGGGDVEAVRADHEPVEDYEAETLGFDDAPEFAALGRRDCSGVLGQCERRDLDACIAGVANDLAGVAEREFLERFVADGVTEDIIHCQNIQFTGFLRMDVGVAYFFLCRSEPWIADAPSYRSLRATRMSDRPRHGRAPSIRRQIHTVLSNNFNATLLMWEVPSTRLESHQEGALILFRLRSFSTFKPASCIKRMASGRWKRRLWPIARSSEPNNPLPCGTSTISAPPGLR